MIDDLWCRCATSVLTTDFTDFSPLPKGRLRRNYTKARKIIATEGTENTENSSIIDK